MSEKKLRIEEVMRKCGVGATELGSRLGVDRQSVYYYIRQDDKNPVSQLEKIAVALGVDLSELFPTESVSGYLEYKNEVLRIRSFEDLERILSDRNKKATP